jgi:drug/metabolite transporter (DMT)-like permease
MGNRSGPEYFKALLAAFSCVLFWGFSFVSIKIAIGFFGPMTLGAIRFAMALILLFFIKRRLVPGEKIKCGDLPFFAGAGLTGVTLYFFCENNGVALVTASEASIIIAAIPVITMIVEWVDSRVRGGRDTGSLSRFAHKPPNNCPQGDCLPCKQLPRQPVYPGFCGTKRRKNPQVRQAARPLPFIILRWAGAVLSIFGVALVAGVSFTLSGSASGYLFMGGACISWVAYCFFTRPLLGRYSRICVVFWQSLFGFAGFLPFVFFEPLPNLAPPPGVWAHIVFLGVCCSALGYWFYAGALEVLGVGVSSVFINFIPVITAAAGFFILGDRLSPLQWAGAALVVAGVYLVMVEPKSAAPSAG